MFYIEESQDSYVVMPCYNQQKEINIEEVSYCNRLSLMIRGNIEKGEE